MKHIFLYHLFGFLNDKCSIQICLKDVECNKQYNYSLPLKSTSPLPSVSNMSITLWTKGFCCNSGKDINSSILKEPELSKSSFLNRLPSLLISSTSTEMVDGLYHLVKKIKIQWYSRTRVTFLPTYVQHKPDKVY